MMMTRAVPLWLVVVSCIAGITAGPASSQDYPSRPIKIIVPLAPGGLADTLARIVSQRLAEASGQSVVVENRPGGAGAVGAEAAARSPADGYTIFMGSLATNAVIAHLTKLNFDPNKDLVPITHVATFPNVLVVNPKLPATSVKELVAYAKANPGKLSYASQGNAASGHLVGEQFKQVAGIDMVHVPYRGAAPAIQDLIAGHVQVMFDSVTLQTPLINDGKTRGLAVLTPKRVASIPDVPTMEEAGISKMQSGTWFGLFAPAGTPPAAIAWVNAEARRAFDAESVRQRYLAQGTLLPLGTPAEFAAHIAAEQIKWGAVIRQANIRLK
ncbi:MAG: Bug family tripartite tricarboxylate transporter substrate binding protein [Xanthobacteraceae bacterium]